MIRVAVDALGGDRAPEEIVAGAADAASADIQPILYGPPGLDTLGLPLVETTGTIDMDDHPVEAVRAKPDSSLVRAVRAVADGEADTVVSAGSTGAMLAASLLHIRRLPGVHRPGIGVVIPGRRGPDRPHRRRRERRRAPGASPPVRPHGRGLRPRDPRCRRSRRAAALDRRGGREGQPADARGERAPAREQRSASTGNTESRTLLEGDSDVVVCDGFTGNVALKALEGTIRTILDSLRAELESSLRGRLGGLLIRPAARSLRRRLDPDTYGGAYLLGLRGLVVIAHGSSSRVAIANAIRLAARGVEHDVVGRLEKRAQRVRVSIRALHDPDGTEVRFSSGTLA